MIPQAGSPSALSVVIPLYNEAETLPLLVNKLLEVLAHHPAFLEVVFVDDGSRDATATLVRELAAREPRLRLVQHEQNRGLGAAIRTGLAAAAGNLILYTDADLPFDFQLIPQLLERAGERSIVIGYRLNRGEGARRWVLTKGYNLLCRLLLGVRVRDVNFACKLLPRAAVHRMQLGAEGSFIDVEILLECRRQGLAIVEFPLTYFPRTLGQSTLSRPAVILGIVKELCAYFQRSYFQRSNLSLPVEVQPDYSNEL